MRKNHLEALRVVLRTQNDKKEKRLQPFSCHPEPVKDLSHRQVTQEKDSELSPWKVCPEFQTETL
jgi:hypothetical protein